MIKINKAQEARIEKVFQSEKPFCTCGDEPSLELVTSACMSLAMSELVELIDDNSNERVGYVLRKHANRIVDLLNAAASEGKKK